jgi:hypothetical protein
LPVSQDINAVVFARPPAGGGAAPVLPATPPAVARPFAYDPAAMELRGLRAPPAVLIVRAGGLGLNVEPHAGFGVDAGGSAAEAGATFRFGSVKAALQDRLRALGVKDGAAAYGDRGRFYLFAAVRGQAVGLNMQRSGLGFRRDGWSTDVSSALIGDGQVGVGWRKGAVEADLGYVRRGVQLRNAPLGVSDSYAADMAALSLTFRPHW